MKPEQLLLQFEELSERLGIRLVEEKGNFNGGSCRLREQNCIVINKHRPAEQKLRILAEAFSQLDLSSVYLVPNLRAYIDKVQTLGLEPTTAKTLDSEAG